MPDITLITKTRCPNCKAIKKRLDANSIQYRTLNAETDDEGSDAAATFKLKSVPALIVDGDIHRDMGAIMSAIGELSRGE